MAEINRYGIIWVVLLLSGISLLIIAQYDFVYDSGGGLVFLVFVTPLILIFSMIPAKLEEMKNAS